jgi:hypothetical protein
MFSCNPFRNNKQLSVSKDLKSLEQFGKSTSFPYQANEDRRLSILSNYKRLQTGMNGDEVLSIMGNPDETNTLVFLGGSPKGWFWDYNLSKKFERAPDDSDRFVEIYFDTNGKVKEISVKTE